MSEQISLLMQLLGHIENYQNEVGNADIKEFALFLKERVMPGSIVRRESDFDKNNYEVYAGSPEVEFSSLLTNLYRFAKHYSKKAFGGTLIKTNDEFDFLATLLLKKSLLKNELINRHLLETSSGSEVIKRLIKNGLVSELPDEKDKRAKRVLLTPKGELEILNIFDNMHQVSEIIIGNLTKEEIVQALSIFNKLNYFHRHIHERDKNSPIQIIREKYIHKEEEAENTDNRWSWSRRPGTKPFID